MILSCVKTEVEKSNAKPFEVKTGRILAWLYEKSKESSFR